MTRSSVKKYLVWLTLILPVDTAYAGFADTPGKGTIVIDVGVQNPNSKHRLDENGKLGNLNEDIVMYDPAGNPLGTIQVPARHFDQVVLTQIFYGFTEKLAAGLIIPYFKHSHTDLNLNWKSGAYASDLGRPYSTADFWNFAQGMGQKRPPDFDATNRLGDIIIGGVYGLQKTKRYQTSVLAFVSTRTGEKVDPEKLGGTGTNGFELQSNGDVGLHLLGDYNINPRISVGGETFYEWYFPRFLPTAKGKENPLLSYEGKYAGKRYLVIPGDWIGGSAGVSFILLRGTNEPSWITRKKPAMQKTLPPLLTVQPGFKYIRFFGNRYRSESDYFDHKQNDKHPNGFRVNSKVKTSANFLRYGVPLSFYYEYMSQELIKGKNFFPIVNHTYGVQAFGAF